MRILITGGAGFIGSHIVDLCIAAGHKVAVVDNFWAEGGGKEAHLHPEAHLYRADITDEEALTHIFDQFKPEAVSHQAAQPSVSVSTRDPQFDARVNILGLLNVLSNCTRVGVSKIVMASSAATYGSPVHLPLDEEAPQLPESPYGITKMVAEHYLRYWHAAHGLNYTILRYGNVYGPRQNPYGEAGVIAVFAMQFQARQSVRIDGDGQQQRDYVYVTDVARANLLALTTGDSQTFCIGTGRAISINEVYQTLVHLTGYEPPITRAPSRLGDIYQSYFNISKAQHDLHWTPEMSFEKGLKATL